MATVFTNVGIQWAVDKLDDSQATTANRIAWGTGAGTAAVGDTTLFTETTPARATGTVSQQTTNGAIPGDTYQVIGTLTADAGKTITNAGLFDAATTGNMIIKGDFTGVPLLTGDSIEFTFKLQVTQ